MQANGRRSILEVLRVWRLANGTLERPNSRGYVQANGRLHRWNSNGLPPQGLVEAAGSKALNAGKRQEHPKNRGYVQANLRRQTAGEAC